VFSNGKCSGFNTLIPNGGQTEPSTILGDKLAWKKAQKKEKKNITSETINKIIPNFNPLTTLVV